MRSKGIWAGALLAGALIVGCTEQPLPTEDIPEAAFNFMNNAKDGPVVFRINNEAWWSRSNDPDRNRTAFHGWDVTDDLFCGGSSVGDTVDVQTVYPGNGEFYNRIVHADNQYVAVYSTGDICDLWGCPFSWDTYCANMTGPYLIAYGDDVKVRASATPGKSTSIKWEGFITSWADGSTLHYFEHQKSVWQQGVRVWPVEDIKLTPVPGR